MSGPKRPAIEWIPSPAGEQALLIAQRLYPQLSRPALIEKLLITGLSAIRHAPWTPPPLWGSDRMAWKLPVGLAEPGSTGNTGKPSSN